MARQEHLPPREVFQRAGTVANTLAALLRKDTVLEGATPQENPGQLTWPCDINTVGTRARVLMKVLRVREAYEPLFVAVEEISAGDFFQDAPDELRKAVRKAPDFQPGICDAIVSPNGCMPHPAGPGTTLTVH